MDKDLPPCALIMPCGFSVLRTALRLVLSLFRAPQACLSFLSSRHLLHMFISIFLLVRNVS